MTKPYSSGFFAEATAMGASWNSMNGFGVRGHLGIQGGRGGSGVWSNVPGDLNSLKMASIAPSTVAGMAYGLYSVAMNGGYINADETGIDFVTPKWGAGAISLGNARVYEYGGKGPGDIVRSTYANGRFNIDLGKHEKYHTMNQWRVYGIVFALMWAWEGGAVGFNPYEQVADLAAMQ